MRLQRENTECVIAESVRVTEKCIGANGSVVAASGIAKECEHSICCILKRNGVAQKRSRASGCI